MSYDYSTLDVIDSTAEETVLKIIDWYNNDNIKLDYAQISVPNGLIKMTNSEILFLSPDNTIFFCWKGPYEQVALWHINKDTGQILVNASLTSKNIEDSDIRKLTLIWKSLQAYLLYYKNEENKVSQSTKIIKKESRQKNSRRRRVSTVYVTKRTYSFKNNVSSKKPKQKKTDSWTVRGHIRHLKNGKEIYVRPYLKGIGTKITKEYKL